MARNKLYDLDDIGVYADLTGLCTPAVVAINIYIYIPHIPYSNIQYTCIE